MEISVGQLGEIIGAVKGARVITFKARTEPKLPKKNPLFGRLVKVSKVNGMIGWIYENSVNRQREREGLEPDFEAEPRAWGSRVRGTPFVHHNGNVYVEVKVERSLGSTYYVDGHEIDPTDEAYAPHMPAPADFPVNQGVDRPIILRDYRIENIRELHLGGEVYVVVDRAPELVSV